MLKKLMLVPALFLAVSGFSADVFEEGDNQLVKGRKPLMVKVDEKGNHTVLSSVALTRESAKAIAEASSEEEKNRLMNDLVAKVEASSTPVAAQLSFNRDASQFKDEVIGKPAWWYYSYGWSFYYVSYVYVPVYYVVYPVYRYRYTYWVVW